MKTAQDQRDVHLNEFILPYVVDTLNRHPSINSAAMCLSHFAGFVNICFIWSELHSPNIDSGLISEHNGEPDPVNLPTTGPHAGPGAHFQVGHVDEKRANLNWESRGSAVTMYACFCREEERHWSHATSPILTTLPYAIFRQHRMDNASAVGYALNPKKQRPELDGITPDQYAVYRSARLG